MGALDLCYSFSLSLCPLASDWTPWMDLVCCLLGLGLLRTLLPLSDFVHHAQTLWDCTLLCVLACVGIVPILPSLRESLDLAAPSRVERLG